MHKLFLFFFFIWTDEKWKELSEEQRNEKEQFLKGEEASSKSHMHMVCKL